MKRRHFTLIEMLVVVAVIAILIGILIPTIGTVMEKVKQSQTKAVINSLRLAIKQYESTYGFLPFTGGNADKSIIYEPGSPINSEYTDLLTTLEGSDITKNPRGIKFLDLSDADYSDAWDEELSVVLDLDYNEDSAADVDMNVVMTGGGEFVELQGTGEEATFDRNQLEQMLELADSGIKNLLAAQRAAIGSYSWHNAQFL